MMPPEWTLHKPYTVECEAKTLTIKANYHRYYVVFSRTVDRREPAHGRKLSHLDPVEVFKFHKAPKNMRQHITWREIQDWIFIDAVVYEYDSRIPPSKSVQYTSSTLFGQTTVGRIVARSMPIIPIHDEVA